MNQSGTVASGCLGEGVRQVTAHLRQTLLGALRGAGRGHFMLRYETYKAGKFRVDLDGTERRRFYITSEDVAARLIELRNPLLAAEGTIHQLMTHLECTLLEALETAGFGHFSVWYDRHDEHTFQIIVDGTQRCDFLVPVAEVIGM